MRRQYVTSVNSNFNKPFHSSSFRYRLTYIDRYVINPDASCARLFLSQPITTLENVSYISLAQPELKKLWIISQTNYLTVAYLLVDNVSTCKCCICPRNDGARKITQYPGYKFCYQTIMNVSKDSLL